MSMCVGSICAKAVRLRDSEAEIVDALDAFISVTATKFTNTSKVINQHHSVNVGIFTLVNFNFFFNSFFANMVSVS